ncbi:MAG: hypothetical protein NXI04_15900 [Planctomycetaceae bacterium]|nr:hypothetical protein [Planctomycetaceae bacterium]
MTALFAPYDIGSELELDSPAWEVPRLVSRGILAASEVGNSRNRTWKATAEAIQRAATSDDLNGPRLHREWFDSRVINNHAQNLKVAIRRLCEQRLADLEEDPQRDFTLSFDGQIRTLANSEPRTFIRLSQDRLPATNAECLYLDEVRSQCLRITKRLQTPTSRSLIGSFYDPANYRDILDRAFAEVRATVVSASRSFPDSRQINGYVVRTCSFNLGAIPVQKTDVERWF